MCGVGLGLDDVGGLLKDFAVHIAGVGTLAAKVEATAKFLDRVVGERLSR